MTGWKATRFLIGDERKAKIEAFIRTKGVTRCPTACVAETQGMPSPSDQEALRDYVTEREEGRWERITENRARINAVIGPLVFSEK
jgi:hypothetical protein